MELNTVKSYILIFINNITFYTCLPIQRPLIQEKSKTLWSCFSNDQITVEARIPKCGFVPGETIPVHLEINNLTSSVIEEITLKLVVKVLHKIRALKSSKKDKATLTKTRISKEIINSKNFAVSGDLTIPPTLPSSENICELIDIYYNIEVHVGISGVHTELKANLPVVIGIIPLGVAINSASGGNFDLHSFDMGLYFLIFFWKNCIDFFTRSPDL